MAKLTLSVDSVVVAKAKRYARQHGTSVSRLVEGYLSDVTHSSTKGESQEALPPILASLRGILRKANREDYLKYLETKYR
jgi:hypothetical protein